MITGNKLLHHNFGHLGSLPTNIHSRSRIIYRQTLKIEICRFLAICHSYILNAGQSVEIELEATTAICSVLGSAKHAEIIAYNLKTLVGERDHAVHESAASATCLNIVDGFTTI